MSCRKMPVVLCIISETKLIEIVSDKKLCVYVYCKVFTATFMILFFIVYSL